MSTLGRDSCSRFSFFFQCPGDAGVRLASYSRSSTLGQLQWVPSLSSVLKISLCVHQIHSYTLLWQSVLVMLRYLFFAIICSRDHGHDYTRNRMRYGYGPFWTHDHKTTNVILNTILHWAIPYIQTVFLYLHFYMVCIPAMHLRQFQRLPIVFQVCCQCPHFGFVERNTEH